MTGASLTRRLAIAAAFGCAMELAIVLARQAASEDALGLLSRGDQGELGSESAVSAPDDAEGEPNRDWDLLQRRMRDIRAWLEVGKTPIDYPVMADRAGKGDQNSSYYLTHNAFGAPDAYGTPYLDARGEANGSHALVYGHHATDSQHAMFSPIYRAFEPERFARLGSAKWETPDTEMVELEPFCALRVDQSYADIQRFSFDGQGAFRSWLEGILQEATARADKAGEQATRASRCLTLVTCSDRQPGRRARTLVLFTD